MKIYNLYHEPSGNNYFFGNDPRKMFTTKTLAQFILKKTDCYPESLIDDFGDWYTKKFDRDAYEKLEMSSPRKFQEAFLDWIDEYISLKKFCDYEGIDITTEKLIK